MQGGTAAAGLFHHERGGKEMKTSYPRWAAALFMAWKLLPSAPVLGQSSSGYVSAAMEQTFISVHEVDQDGNPLGELGSGWVQKEDQLEISSRTGSIVISYQLSSSDKRFMMDPVSCSGGTVISVP
jgi:hypothetical protein